ncbi:MAG: hypothetical protein EXS18_03755 [Verrucomicrobiae bacterium]|nr:hypothetical protein [Verrucomicrobiae bacterium]
MKKSSQTLVLFVLLILPVVTRAQTTSAPPAAVAAPAATWQIVELTGNVQVRATATGDWANGQVNTDLPIGATVRTGDDGKAVLKAADAAGVTMQPKTTIEVGQLTRSNDVTKVEVKALTGKALFLVNKLKTQDSSFKVETPTAVVGVRGTAFVIKVADDAESSRVAVYTGEVGVQGKGDEPGLVIVKEKMGTNIVRNKPPTPPEALAEAEAAEWEKMKSDIQHSTPMASLVPAIGGMIEMHQLQNAEADKLISDASRAIKGNKKSEQEFKVFEAAIVVFFKDTGELPTKEQGLKALLEDPGVKGWHGPYLDKSSNFLDPYGRPYKWLSKKSPAGKDFFEVRSGGPDGFVGNEDDHVKMIRPASIQKLASENKPVGQ